MNDMDQNEENDTPRPVDRPLGYWLRAVDALLTREFATALESEGVTRRDWMVLGVLAGDVDAPGLRDRLARKGKRLRELEDRGWVVQKGDGNWELTDLGRAEKERIGEIVDGIRSRVVDAVGADAYAAMTASLEAVARELGWDESTADRSRGFGFGGFGRRGRFGGPGFRPGFGPGADADFGPRIGPGFGGGFGGGFGPGFSGRPWPFQPDIHEGFGPNRHRGFAPGRPGHPAERGDEPLRGYGEYDDGCRGHHPHAGAGHGHGDHGHEGHGHPHHHGHPGHGGGHGHGRHRAQRAYERGFDAGYARGREAGAA